jgi:hypothetical protein
MVSPFLALRYAEIVTNQESVVLGASWWSAIKYRTTEELNASRYTSFLEMEHIWFSYNNWKRTKCPSRETLGPNPTKMTLAFFVFG